MPRNTAIADTITAATTNAVRPGARVTAKSHEHRGDERQHAQPAHQRPRSDCSGRPGPFPRSRSRHGRSRRCGRSACRSGTAPATADSRAKPRSRGTRTSELSGVSAPDERLERRPSAPLGDLVSRPFRLEDRRLGLQLPGEQGHKELPTCDQRPSRSEGSEVGRRLVEASFLKPRLLDPLLHHAQLQVLLLVADPERGPARSGSAVCSRTPSRPSALCAPRWGRRQGGRPRNELPGTVSLCLGSLEARPRPQPRPRGGRPGRGSTSARILRSP